MSNIQPSVYRYSCKTFGVRLYLTHSIRGFPPKIELCHALRTRVLHCSWILSIGVAGANWLLLMKLGLLASKLLSKRSNGTRNNNPRRSYCIPSLRNIGSSLNRAMPIRSTTKTISCLNNIRAMKNSKKIVWKKSGTGRLAVRR